MLSDTIFDHIAGNKELFFDIDDYLNDPDRFYGYTQETKQIVMDAVGSLLRLLFELDWPGDDEPVRYGRPLSQWTNSDLVQFEIDKAMDRNARKRDAKQVLPDEVSLRSSEVEKYQNPRPPKERELLDIKSLMKQPRR